VKILKESLTQSILKNSHTNILEVNTETMQEDLVSSVGTPKYYCVGMIDIVNSTTTVAKLTQNKTARYYEIFLNTMAKAVNKFDAQILKTMGDSLLFYYPNTCHSERKFGFLSCIESGFHMIDTHDELTRQLESENIPKIDFRISFDYGNVTVMKFADWKIDLVGPTINTCAKINGKSPINGMVIGGDLYDRVKHFREYEFKNTDSYSTDLKHPYPLYTISRKK
jgi:adenylate cyclase